MVTPECWAYGDWKHLRGPAKGLIIQLSQTYLSGGAFIFFYFSFFKRVGGGGFYPFRALQHIVTVTLKPQNSNLRISENVLNVNVC